jgi:F0F1-type ATP synthase membrane subunit c/vacuolar-type H+-ATPase subunit K
MFCPRCGSNQSEELKFCKVCGVNLHVIRKVVDTPGVVERIDQNKPWFAELALSDAESKRRKEELDHQRGIAPEVERYNEIKAGVITGSVGLAAAISLHDFMKGLILSGSVWAPTAEILSRLWVFGLIPLFVGLALIINGVVVGKKLAAIARQAARTGPGLPEKDTNPLALGSGENLDFVPSDFSVVEDTTKHLRS